jgi:ABC-type branched-subunit amino acid transport system permease subunit
MEPVEKYKTASIILLALAFFIALPFGLPVYWTMILTEILIMGLLAMSFKLLFGYTGLLSFGQAGFSGAGAYAMALFLSNGGNSLLLGLAAALAAGAITTAVIGFFSVRRDEIHFAMITLGFGMMLYTVAHNWFELTGGSDGLPVMNVPPLNVQAGEIVCLLGRNGAGKTTTMRGIMGYNPPARGSIHFDGRDITGQPVYANVRQGIGFVPEDRRIFPDLSVMENLAVATLPARPG